MTRQLEPSLAILFALLMAAGTSGLSGCASDSYAARGAAEGATTGAVAGAVGGMVSALVFGGNVAEAGARGAVYGGTTGAVVGGMAGSQADRAAAAQRQAERDAELKKLRQRIGPDAYNGVAALAECKHGVAIANAREAMTSGNQDYALAGLWVEMLTEADRQQAEQAAALFPEIVRRDREMRSDADVEMRMNEALGQLADIREEYDLPRTCPT